MHLALLVYLHSNKIAKIVIKVVDLGVTKYPSGGIVSFFEDLESKAAAQHPPASGMSISFLCEKSDLGYFSTVRGF